MRRRSESSKLRFRKILARSGTRSIFITLRDAQNSGKNCGNVEDRQACSELGRFNRRERKEENAEGKQRVMEMNELSYFVINRAMKVHTALGPGLLESAYKECLFYELQSAG